jgi:hypothetical protein
MARHLIRLGREDRWLLVRRYEFYGNSVAALAKALVREGEPPETLRRLRALRRIERRYGIDLGLVCHKIRRCRERRPHPIEKMVIDYVTWPGPEGDDVLVDVERVREVVRLIERSVRHGPS